MFQALHMPVIGHRVILLDSVDSTNNYAATALARHELQHGTAIMALEQTAGSGQRGRAWTTLKGLDLAASVVLLPQGLAAGAQSMLSKMAALAVHDVVAGAMRKGNRNADEVRIKWPNDVLVGREKVAGILIVNEVHGNWLTSSIVGMGINVNSSGWPGEMAATSLLVQTGAQHDLGEVLRLLCQRMEHWWALLRTDPEQLSRAYGQLLWGRGRFCSFILDGVAFYARLLDVDSAGRLLVEDDAGRVAAYGLERLSLQR